MRDLTMYEIEMVSGAGWSDWFGGISETISRWFSSVQQFFSSYNIPTPSQAQLDLVQSNCTYGISSMTLTNTGASASLTLSAVNGTIISLTQGSGTFSFTCQPNPHP